MSQYEGAIDWEQEWQIKFHVDVLKLNQINIDIEHQSCNSKYKKYLDDIVMFPYPVKTEFKSSCPFFLRF